MVAEQETPLAREITQGGYGIVVHPGDKIGLQAALKRLADPSEVAKMSALAAERAIFFSRERVLGEYAALLQKMV